MQLQDELQSMRDKLAEQNAAQRFSNQELTRYANEARREISLATQTPVIRAYGTATAGYQEYNLSEDIFQIDRVYVGGQRCPETDIASMEGDAIQFFDQSGPQMQPQWTIAPPTFYPVSADNEYPAPIATPYYAGKRPMFYREGGVVGFVPPPGGGEQILVVGRGVVQDLVNLQDQDIFPRYFLMSIAWRGVCLALFADKDQESYPIALAEAENALRTLRDQIKNMTPHAGMRPMPYRLMFEQGGVRRGGWGRRGW